MAFDIIKKETRVARMIAWLAGVQTKITDFSPGGKTRTKIDAIALELEQQDYHFYRAVTQAIPIALYRAFNFPPLAAIRATGSVVFTALAAPGANVAIPIGTRISTVGTETATEKVYETTAAATLLAGQTTVTVAISAAVTGRTGNTGVGTITNIKTSISGIDSVSNPSAVTNGADRESEADRAARFRDYIATIKRGTAAALEYAAKTATLSVGTEITERVTNALSVDHEDGGFVDLFIYNGVGSPSAQLIARTQQIIDGYSEGGVKIPGYKAAGIIATVLAVTEIPQDVTVVLAYEAGYSGLGSKAQAAIDAYVSGLEIGQDMIRNELIERLMVIPGIKDLTLSAPAANVPAQQVTAVAFTGGGLNDATSGGAYTGSGRSIYRVEITATGAPDTFRWSDDDGLTWTTGVAITGSAQALNHGVTITFAATTGHTLAAAWTFSGTRAVILTPGTVTIT